MLSLHDCARHEEQGHDVTADVLLLLSQGPDPHVLNAEGETAFNIAASNAPITGRLLTLAWLDEALKGKGTKGLNDASGAHGSTLAQYMAKWLSDDEVEHCLAKAVAAGMKPDVPNKSGWTPLIAAAAMGRVKAVQAFLKFYSRDAVQIRTTEKYETRYEGVLVIYAAGLTAAEVARARLDQDTGVSQQLKKDLQMCVYACG